MISMTIRDTFSDMAEALSFRLDLASKRALRKLQAIGMSQSDAIRYALVESAAALANPQRLAAEIAALEADPLDREEMQRVAQLMESLRD